MLVLPLFVIASAFVIAAPDQVRGFSTRNPVPRMHWIPDQVRDDIGEVRDDVGEVRDDVGGVRDDIAGAGNDIGISAIPISIRGT